MQQALDYIMYTYNKFVNFIFNEASLFTDITIGWIVFACFVFWMLMKSILNIPRSMSSWSSHINSNRDYRSNRYSHKYTRRRGRIYD